MQTMNQKTPVIANAVLAIAGFLPYPKPFNCAPAKEIPEYVNATWDVGLTFVRDNDLGSLHLDFDLETYVDAAYAHEAEDRRSVSSVDICCGCTLVSWLSRTPRYASLCQPRWRNSLLLCSKGIPMFLISSSTPISIGVYEDNKRAIDQAKNPISLSNGKYIDVRHHILSELAFSGDISVKYIQSDD